MIIFFFVGLIIMASAGSISDISNVTYLYLVCNAIGGIMMGVSTFFFFKEEARKKNELKLLVEKLSGKEEYENEIYVLNAIEKELQEYRENLRIIGENQEKIIAGVCDNSEIKDSITTINELLKDCFDSLEKQVAIQNSKTAEEIIETLRSIEQRIECVNLLPGEISESVERLITKFEKTVDSIQSDYKNLADDIEDQEKDRTKKYNSIMTEIRDLTEESNEEMTEEIKKLAEQYESFEKIISAIVNQMSHMAEEDIKVMKGFLNG